MENVRVYQAAAARRIIMPEMFNVLIDFPIYEKHKFIIFMRMETGHRLQAGVIDRYQIADFFQRRKRGILDTGDIIFKKCEEVVFFIRRVTQL